MTLAAAKIEGWIGTICLDHSQSATHCRRRWSPTGSQTALESFAADQVRAVVLRARPGVKIWSAGHDVDELPRGTARSAGLARSAAKALIRGDRKHSGAGHRHDRGRVFGGACEAAMACDIIVAAPNATLRADARQAGRPYDVSGMLTFLNGASLRVIKEMAFTARPIGAARALDIGLINHIRRSKASNPSPMRWRPTLSKTRRFRSR